MKYRVDKQITVSELISFLQKAPQDSLVFTEGCDCSGPSDGIDLYAELDKPVRVYIARNDDLK